MTSPQGRRPRRAAPSPAGNEAPGTGSTGRRAPARDRVDLQPILTSPSFEGATTADDPATGTGGRTTAGRIADPNIGRRVLVSQDFLNAESPLDRDSLLMSRAHAATRFHLELADAQAQLGLIRDFVLPTRTVPAT